MCGICGIVENDLRRPVDRTLLERMCGLIRHRGPDDEGYFIEGPAGLGMRRLAIIDLRTGHQPIANEDETIQIIFNGEIYNYPELKKQLLQKGHSFRTRSDTEVIIHLYEEEGEACLVRLRGMFAFALWDSRRQKLLLARDHVGIKPLYYAPHSDFLIFSSELKAILLEPRVQRELDAHALHDYLSLGYVTAPHTIFRAVRKLPPGHLLCWQNGKTRLQSYWDWQFSPGHARTEADYIETCQTRLETAVRRHLISDVPVGIFLSGGVDSGTVTAVASLLSDLPLQTFSIGFANTDFDESKDAQVIAESCGALHHVFRVESNQFDEEMFYRLVRQFDEPFADSSAIPTYFLCRMASEFVKVALSGDGGDELFAGYNKYHYLRTLFAFRQSPELLKKFLAAFSRPLNGHFKAARQFKKGAELIDMSLEEMILAVNFYFNEAEKQHDLYTGDWRAASNGYQTVAILDPFRQAMQKMNAFEKAAFLDFKLGLPDDMLTKVDRMSMLHSLEVRVPLLDFDLIEFAGEVPFSLKLKNGTGKYLLRRAAAARLPNSLAYKRKQGFEIPLHSWINTAFRNVIEAALSEESVRRRGYFNPEYVRKLVKDFLGEGRHFPQLSRYQINIRLWMLLILEHWIRIYVDRNG